MTVYAELQEFNCTGLDVFKSVFQGKSDESSLDPTDPRLVLRVDGTCEFTPSDYASTKEMAQSVLTAIGTVNLSKLLSRTGLWAWLTFVMRNQLFSKTIDGKWRVGEMHRWYPSDPNDWRKGQRHLVRMPVLLLHLLNDDANHLLCSKPSVLPDIREQLTSQQDMFNRPFQKVARTLYFDEVKGTLRRGAGGKGAGSPRRLAKVRQQLDVTWDLEDIEPRRIIGMLPTEFARFITET